jgi:hypothetical protein
MSGEAAPLTPVRRGSGRIHGSRRRCVGPQRRAVRGHPFSAASIISLTTLTGANTESRTVQVFNRGQAGSGTTLMASKAFTSTRQRDGRGRDEPDPLGQRQRISSWRQATSIEVKSLHVGATGLAGTAVPRLASTFTRTAGD